MSSPGGSEVLAPGARTWNGSGKRPSLPESLLSENRDPRTRPSELSFPSEGQSGIAATFSADAEVSSKV